LFFGIATLSPCVRNAKDFSTKVDDIILAWHQKFW
jgi:hypothetical protein